MQKYWDSNPTTSTHIHNGIGGQVVPAGTISPNGSTNSIVVDHYHTSMNMKIPSYEFRVVEHIDNAGKTVKVGLQYREFFHNPMSGNELDSNPAWLDVPRIKIQLP